MSQPNSSNHKDVINHVNADDYFVTLATIINLLQQFILSDLNQLHAIEQRNRQRLDTLQALHRDLLFAQDHYRIIKRSK